MRVALYRPISPARVKCKIRETIKVSPSCSDRSPIERRKAVSRGLRRGYVQRTSCSTLAQPPSEAKETDSPTVRDTLAHTYSDYMYRMERP